MRKFFNDFSCESDHEKITEKTMTKRAISTVAVMLTCLIAMTVTAYAYFSCSVTSSFAAIRTANFYTKISVQEVPNVEAVAVTETAGEGITLETPPVITSDNKAHKVEDLKAGKTYLVTIQPTDNNTAEHGFVIFAAYHTDDNGNASLASSVYHTQQLGVDVAAEHGRTNIISFYLQLDADADVILYSHWGTSSYYGYKNVVQETPPVDGEDLYVEQGETVTVAVTGAVLEDELLPTPTPIPELTPSPVPEMTPTPGPEATKTPAPSSEPTATLAPEATSAPETTSAPESTEAPSVPEATSAPEAAETPIETNTPAATSAPVTPSEPVTPSVPEETPVETQTTDIS